MANETYTVRKKVNGKWIDLKSKLSSYEKALDVKAQQDSYDDVIIVKD
jgi:hypothetical protein